MNPHDMQCECLVIGSGPGGSTTALVLAESGRDVLVLEEGKKPGVVSPYSLDEMNSLYRYGGLAISWGNPNISYLEGCCLGGASEINGGLYHRPLPEILEQWKETYDLQDFGASALESYLEINEKILGIEDEPVSPGVTSSIIERGAKKLHWKAVHLPRMWDYSGDCPQGQRQSMSRSFIPKAKAAGARFVTGAKVLKINCRGDNAYEALCVHTDEPKTAFRVVFKSVFVCAGAVQTPHLLRKSGLTHQVGERLKMHLSIRLVAYFDEPASAPQEGVPRMQVSEFKPQLTLGGSFSGPAYLALWLSGRRDFSELMKSPSQLGIFHAYTIAHAHGRVRSDPLSQEAMLLMDIKKDDLVSIGDAAYKLGQMLFAAGARKIFSPFPGGNDFTCLEDMNFLRDGKSSDKMDLSTIHLFSSCPMGENLSRCAVNSFGRVHGKKNMYVNDASMLPDAPGTNPQSLIMALARRNAMHWLAEDIKQS